MSIISSEEAKKTLVIEGYESWDRASVPFPCVPQTSPSTEGIFYIKVPKTSSSTLAHITSRFSAREAKRQEFKNGYSCKTYEPMTHASAIDYKVMYRNKSKSFLWTVLREPNSRAVSHYGMFLMQNKVKNSLDSFISTLINHRAFVRNTQLNYLVTDGPIYPIKSDEAYIDVIQNILDEYNFIGIYERLAESLVVLTMIMGMGITDVLYDFRPSHNTRCDSLVSKPSWLTSDMEEYLKTEKWTNKQKGDFMLYDAVNEKLDATIDKLGRSKVELNVVNFKRLIRIGTTLSNKIVRKENKQMGCGVRFPRHHWGCDIDELDYFDTLNLRDQRFVKHHKNPEFTLK